MRGASGKWTWQRLLSVVGCVLCWLAAAFFAFLEWAAVSWFWELLPDVIFYGYDELEGYNLRLAEDFWGARMLMLLFGIPFVLFLVLAIRFTMKLKRQGKKHEHPVSDPW